MLIVNNGVRKSGTAWVQRVVDILAKPAYPSEYWRNGWANPSVDPDRLQAYVASGEWRPGPCLVKLHLANDPGFLHLHKGEVRVLVSWRDLPDAVVAVFHEQAAAGLIPAADSAEGRQRWFAGSGMTFARTALLHRISWRGYPNALLLRYADMLADPATALARIAAHIAHPVSAERAAALAARTAGVLTQGAHPGPDGSGPAWARLTADDLPADIRAMLTQMDRAERVPA